MKWAAVPRSTPGTIPVSSHSLPQISQRVAPEDKEVLRRCGEILTQVERFDAAKEVYKKVGDNEGLLKVGMRAPHARLGRPRH